MVNSSTISFPKTAESFPGSHPSNLHYASVSKSGAHSHHQQQGWLRKWYLFNTKLFQTVRLYVISKKGMGMTSNEKSLPKVCPFIYSFKKKKNIIEHLSSLCEPNREECAWLVLEEMRLRWSDQKKMIRRDFRAVCRAQSDLQQSDISLALQWRRS